MHSYNLQLHFVNQLMTATNKNVTAVYFALHFVSGIKKINKQQLWVNKSVDMNGIWVINKLNCCGYYHQKYWVAHKKRPKLCNDVVLLNNRIQTKGNNILQSNHSWTIWEIMMLYGLFWQWNTQKSVGCLKSTK